MSHEQSKCHLADSGLGCVAGSWHNSPYLISPSWIVEPGFGVKSGFKLCGFCHRIGCLIPVFGPELGIQPLRSLFPSHFQDP